MAHWKTTLVLAALLAAATLPAPAAACPPHAIERFDANGDGQLDETERAAAKAARQERLQKFDSDGDGQLSEAERSAAKAQMRQRFDTDGDGQLSDAEKQAARRQRKAQPGSSASPGSRS